MNLKAILIADAIKYGFLKGKTRCWWCDEIITELGMIEIDKGFKKFYCANTGCTLHTGSDMRMHNTVRECKK